MGKSTTKIETLHILLSAFLETMRAQSRAFCGDCTVTDNLKQYADRFEYTFEAAERFLKMHYSEDVLNKARVKQDRLHWQSVLMDHKRFPNADRQYLEAFILAADMVLVTGGIK